MKKVLTVLLILAVSCFALVAKSEAEAANASDEIKLTMFEYQDLTNEVEMSNWDVLLDRFFELNPDISFDIETANNQPYHDKLQVLATSGQLPDIMFLWPGKRTGNVTGKGLIKDLRPWLSGHEDEFSPAALAAQGMNGEIYELPEQVTVTHVMFTNNKLLDELGLTFPETYEELLAQGEVIRAAGYIPIAMDNADGWEMQSCLASALVERTAGMDWYTKLKNGDPSVSLTDPEFVNAMKIIKELSDKDMFSPGINQAAYGIAMADFVNEQAVYLIDGGWRVNDLTRDLTDEQKTYMTLETFPDVPNQKGTSGSTAVVAGTGYGMNAKLEGEEADAAWDWIWFYSGPEGSKIRQQQGAMTAYNLPVPAGTDPLIVALYDFVANTPAGYVLDAILDAEGIGNIYNAGLQEIMLTDKTPEAVGAEYEAWAVENESARKQ